MEGSPISGEGVERIKAAAVVFKGQLYTGFSHAFALRALAVSHPEWKNINEEKPEEGWVTTRGRFVDRVEAGAIADKAEQLDHLGEEDRRAASKRLYSEDFHKE